MLDTTGTDVLIPFGVSAASGCPLNNLSDDPIKSLLKRERERLHDPETIALAEKLSVPNYGVIGEVDGEDLKQAGWGVLFAPGTDPAIRRALQPLLDHRRERDEASPFAMYDGDDAYRSGETASQWLGRPPREVKLDVVNPDKGVPYYLLIVAPADKISFEFQYSLDIYWAVGRLWFDTVQEFEQYVQSVISYETAAAVSTSRKIALFAPEHDFDDATQLFTSKVVRPLMQGEGATPTPLGSRQGFSIQAHLGSAATKTSLADIMRGSRKYSFASI